MRSKFTELVLLFGLLHVSYSFPSSHDEFDVCQKRHGYFPKPGSSCRSYYKCVEFQAIEIECPEDQHFFPAKEYCVFPEEYPCLEKSKSKKCPLPDGKFMKPNTRCKVYYHCRKGVSSEKRCKGELLFDPFRRECEYPEYVTCPEDVKPTESSQSTPVITTFTFDGTSITTAPTVSSTLIRRSTTSSNENSSEEGNSSGEDNQSSTKSKKMSTTLGSTTVLKSSSITESRTKSVTSTIVDNISTVSDKNGGSSEGDSQPSTKSIINEDISTVSDKIGSNTKDTQSSTKSKPTTVTISTLFKSSSIEENRTKLITTTTTENILTVSDEGGEYTVSGESTSTKFPERKDTDSTMKTSSITDFVTSHIFCPRPDGYFPHPNDRHKFIACVAGNLIIMDCPENLVYNQKRKECQYEKMAL